MSHLTKAVVSKWLKHPLHEIINPISRYYNWKWKLPADNVRQGWWASAHLPEVDSACCTFIWTIQNLPTHLGGKGANSRGPRGNEEVSGDCSQDESCRQGWERAAGWWEVEGGWIGWKLVDLEVGGLPGWDWKEFKLKVRSWNQVNAKDMLYVKLYYLWNPCWNKTIFATKKSLLHP